MTTDEHDPTTSKPRSGKPLVSRHAQAGRLGALTKWSQTEDRSAATQPARDGLQRRFENEVDPGRKLPADELAIRADFARRAHFQRLAMKSAAARRAKRKGGGAG